MTPITPGQRAIEKPSPLDNKEVWARYYADLWQAGEIRNQADVDRLVGELREIKKIRKSFRTSYEKTGLPTKVEEPRAPLPSIKPTAAATTATPGPSVEKGGPAEIVKQAGLAATEDFPAVLKGLAILGGLFSPLGEREQMEKLKGTLDRAAAEGRAEEEKKKAETEKALAATPVAPAATTAVAQPPPQKPDVLEPAKRPPGPESPEELKKFLEDPKVAAELVSSLLPVATEVKPSTTRVAPRIITKEKAKEERAKTDIQQLMDVDAAAERFGDETIGKVLKFIAPNTFKRIQEDVPAAPSSASYEERQAVARARLQRLFELSPRIALEWAILLLPGKAGKAKLEAGAAKAGREAAEAAGLSKAEIALPEAPLAEQAATVLKETGAAGAKAGVGVSEAGLAEKVAQKAPKAGMEPTAGPQEIIIPPEGKVPRAPKVRLKQPFGTRNKVFTQERFNAAIQRAGKQRPQAGLDPQMFQDFVDIGGYYVEGGVREFGPWSEEMVKQLGEGVKPHLQRVYQQAVKNVDRSLSGKAEESSLAVQGATKGSQAVPVAPKQLLSAQEISGRGLSLPQKPAKPVAPKITLRADKKAKQDLLTVETSEKSSAVTSQPRQLQQSLPTEGAVRLPDAFASNLKAAGVKSSEDFAVAPPTGKRRGPPITPKKRPSGSPDELPSVPGDVKPDNLPAFERFRRVMQTAGTFLRELGQDEYIRVRKLLERPDVKVSEATNLSDKQILLFGRVGHRLKEADQIAADIDKGIVQSAKELNLPDKELLDEVNKYLHYRHAPERNAALGEKAAGIGTAEAKAELAKLEALPHAGKIKELGGKISELNQKTLDILLDGEVIDQKLYDTLRKKYKNHVPLNRVFAEGDDIVDVLASKGFDVRSTGIKKAVGSERPVADILTNVVANYKSAIARAEKNQLDLATLRFVRENKAALGDLFEEIRPKFIGKGAEEHPIFRRIDDPQVLQLREAGKPVFLKINDPHLATAIRGVNPLKQDVFVRWIGPMTRLYSGLATRFNPEFAIPNKIRDIQEAAIYAASRPEVGFKSAGGIVGREAKAQNILAVKDYLRGNNTEGARLYRQMLEDGGATGGLSLSTRKAVELDINKIRALQRSAPRKAARQIIDWVDNLNEIFENSTRLSVYRQALADGLSRQKAAVLAKEATINFNKKGTGGPLLNSLYMFSNASIQGSAKMFSALRNRKVAAAVVSSVGASTFAVNEWNDSIDPEWREKVSKWDRFNGLPVLLSSDEKEGINYFTLPISWGIKPIKVAADYTFDAAAGKSKGIVDAVSGVTGAFFESFNPLGGTELNPLKPSTYTPSIIRPLAERQLNRAWTGNPIRPDWDKYAPASTKYFQSLEESPEGKAAIAATGKLSKMSGGRIEISPADVKYLYEQYISGVGRFGSSIVETVNEVAKGRAPKVSKIPVVRRFFRSRTAEELAQRKGGETERVEKILTEQSRERFELNKQAEKVFGGLKQLPEDEILSRLERLAETNYPLAKEAYEVWQDEQLGLTREEKLVKQLGVENGARARYLFEKYQQIKPEEREAFIETMQQKRILTEKVGEQLGELVEQGQSK